MSYKQFDLSQDVASVVSAINEVVFVSSSLFTNDLNVKFYKNISSASAGVDLGGYFETIYDSSPTSSLATPIMDLTYGLSTGSVFNVSVTSTSSLTEKVKIYREMASVLLGDPDATFTVNNAAQTECFFIMIKRNLMKDEIKKGSVSFVLNQGTSQTTASDDGAVTSFKQTVGGDFAPLKFSGTGSEVGQVWYQAGVVVIPDGLGYPGFPSWSGTVNLLQAQPSSSINQLVDGLRRHVEKFSFHNQTNLYSTVYFCRATNQDFNYSSNPTFVDGNKRIRVTSGSNILQTRTYITTIGLYDPNDNLLAVAKVNKPITKSPDNEAVFRIRLDF